MFHSLILEKTVKERKTEKTNILLLRHCVRAALHIQHFERAGAATKIDPSVAIVSARDGS